MVMMSRKSVRGGGIRLVVYILYLCTTVLIKSNVFVSGNKLFLRAKSSTIHQNSNNDDYYYGDDYYYYYGDDYYSYDDDNNSNNNNNDDNTNTTPTCVVPNQDLIGDGNCDGDVYNTIECNYDGGDCLPTENNNDDDNSNINDDDTTNTVCIVPNLDLIGNGKCDGDVYNTTACRYDGGDCLPTANVDDDDDSNSSNDDDTSFVCNVPDPNLIGDGNCDGDLYNTTACNYDGGDCLLNENISNDDDSNSSDDYINSVCIVPYLKLIGDGNCDGDVYNTTACNYDGGDCLNIDNTGNDDDSNSNNHDTKNVCIVQNTIILFSIIMYTYH